MPAQPDDGAVCECGVHRRDQLEGLLIQPLAQKWAVALPPVIGLLAIVVAGAMSGRPGVLFGAPLAVLLNVLLKRYWIDRHPSLPSSCPRSRSARQRSGLHCGNDVVDIVDVPFGARA